MRPQTAVRVIPSALALAFALVARPAAAIETSLHMVSDVGDYIGQGATYYFTPATGTFAVTNAQREAVQVTYNAAGHNWSLYFAGPADTRIAPGFYPQATRWPFHEGDDAALSIFGNGRGCNTNTGAFYVKQATFGAGGEPTSLRVTFEQHCEGNPKALRGELRWNAEAEVDVQARLLVGASTGTHLALPVTATDVGGTPSLEALDLPAGASFVVARDDSATLMWTPAIGQIGTHVVRFVAHGAGGATDTIASQVTVAGEMLVRVEGEPGSEVFEGVARYTNNDGTFTCFVANPNRAQFYFVQPGQNGDRWEVGLRPADGAVVQPGVYEAPYPGEYYFGPGPALRVVNDFNNCQTSFGHFRVRTIQFGPGNLISALRATFEYHCAGSGPAASGEIRFNLGLPVAIEAPILRTVRRGSLLTFGVTARADDGSALTLTAESMPPGAQFTDHGNGTGTLTWLPGASVVNGRRELRLIAHSAGGHADTAWTTLNVTGGDRFRVQSPQGDWIGAGETRDYRQDSVTVSPSYPYAGLQFTAVPLDQNQRNFTLQFRTAQGEVLLPGRHYAPTNSATEPNPGQAAMQISSSGRGCSSVPGVLWVKEAEYGPLGVNAFRAVFEQRCDGGPPLRGEIRYRPRGPLMITAPFARTVQAGVPQSFDLDSEIQGSSLGFTPSFTLVSAPPGATITSLGPGRARVTWTPAPAQIGDNLVVVAASTAAGGVDTSETVVNVTGETSLAVYSPPGEPIGGGNSHFYTLLDGTFAAAPIANGLNASFTPDGFTSSWGLVAQPASGSLATGFYTDTRGYPDGIHPVLRVFSPNGSTYCSLESGWYQVRQYTTEPNGTVKSFWLRFYDQCVSGSPGLAGEWRYNVDVSVTIAAPAAVDARQGEQVSIGTLGTARDGSPTTLWATGLPAGASFLEVGSDVGLLLWTPAGNQFGTHHVVFHVRDGSGREDSTMTRIRVLGVNAFRYESEGPNDPLGMGESRSFGPGDGRFSMTTGYPNFEVFEFDTSANNYYSDYSAAFAPPGGSPLIPGFYLDAVGTPTSEQAGFSVRIQGRACYYYFGEARSDFRIRHLSRRSDNSIGSFAADFETACSDTFAGLRGSVLFGVQKATRVDAPIRVRLSLGQPARFLVTGRGTGGPVAFGMLTPPAGATLTPVAADTAEFAWTPGSSDIGLEHVRFTANSADGTGADTVEVLIDVRGITDLQLASDGGDPIGNGDTLLILRDDADWTVERNSQNGVSVRLLTHTGEWQLDFSAPQWQELTVGAYLNAGRFPFQDFVRPGLSISRTGGSCNTILGSFVVRHLVWGPHDEVKAFWATFEQRCNGMQAALTGEIRWNLDAVVPVQVSLVTANWEADGVHLEWRMGSQQAATLERRMPDGEWTFLANLLPDGLGAITYLDRDAQPGRRYAYRLGFAEGGGMSYSPEAWVETSEPLAFGIQSARPNPGPGFFTLPLALPRATAVKVSLLDVSGRVVWSRPEATLAAGRHALTLDTGGSVPPGVYLVNVQAGSERRWQRVSIVR